MKQAASITSKPLASRIKTRLCIGKPRLSSTIFDFKVLRSAIKYALEVRGCEVLASEFNDFTVDSSSHRYEACLTNIAKADYFVLLIGSRVGGNYPLASR